MKIITNLNAQEQFDKPVAAALGFFDGMHLGHQKILENTNIRGYSRGVVMFAEMPRGAEKPQGRLMRLTDRLAFLKDAGIQIVFLLDFEQVKNVGKEDFVAKYLKSFGIGCAVAGFNYTFGCGASGDVRDLESLCAQNGIRVKVIPPVDTESIRISSSMIRCALQNGDVEKAAKMLGRPHGLAVRFAGNERENTDCGKYFTLRPVSHDIMIPKPGCYEALLSQGDTQICLRAAVKQNRTLVCAAAAGINENAETEIFLAFLKANSETAE